MCFSSDESTILRFIVDFRAVNIVHLSAYVLIKVVIFRSCRLDVLLSSIHFVFFLPVHLTTHSLEFHLCLCVIGTWECDLKPESCVTAFV